jgi:hypothetical protein
MLSADADVNAEFLSDSSLQHSALPEPGASFVATRAV